MANSRINGSHLIFDTASFTCKVGISNAVSNNLGKDPRWHAVARNKSVLLFQEGRDFFRDVCSILSPLFL